MEAATATRLRAEWWPPSTGDEVLSDVLDDGRTAWLEVERDEDDTNRINVHTFVDGRGSLSSYTFDREEVRRFALRLLLAAEV